VTKRARRQRGSKLDIRQRLPDDLLGSFITIQGPKMYFRITLATGIVLGLIGGTVVAQEKNDQIVAPKTDQPGNAPIPQGRFQIVISPLTARDTFLLDTETGRVWQMTQLSFLIGEPVVWDLMPRIDSDDDYAKVVNTHGRKPTQSQQVKSK
jgi:hypothetical protein